MFRHLICFEIVATGAAASSPLLPIHLRQKPTGEQAFVDSDGRERLFRGTNAITKGPPWVPDTRSYSSDLSMVAQDFEQIASMGMNVLRLGAMWSGIEPVRGQYNETYLAQLKKIVDGAAQYGIYTLLDMHQDGLSEFFCGEGIPTWAVRQTREWEFRSGGLFAFPAPYSRLNNETDYLHRRHLLGRAATAYTQRVRHTQLRHCWLVVRRHDASSQRLRSALHQRQWDRRCMGGHVGDGGGVLQGRAQRPWPRAHQRADGCALPLAHAAANAWMVRRASCTRRAFRRLCVRMSPLQPATSSATRCYCCRTRARQAPTARGCSLRTTASTLCAITALTRSRTHRQPAVRPPPCVSMQA
jgi:hypothetical protein